MHHLRSMVRRLNKTSAGNQAKPDAPETILSMCTNDLFADWSSQKSTTII